ncbi:hypothetical protein J437_LFUL008377, partial [Ladona fulva]
MTPVRPWRKHHEMISSQLTQPIQEPLGLGAHTGAPNFGRELIGGDMAQKLFLITQKIHKKMPSQSDGETSILDHKVDSIVIRLLGICLLDYRKISAFLFVTHIPIVVLKKMQMGKNISKRSWNKRSSVYQTGPGLLFSLNG